MARRRSSSEVIEPYGAVGVVELVEQVFPGLRNQLLGGGRGVFDGAGLEGFNVGRGGSLRSRLRKSSSPSRSAAKFLSVVKSITAGVNVTFPVGADADQEPFHPYGGTDAALGQVEPHRPHFHRFSQIPRHLLPSEMKLQPLKMFCG